MCKNIFIFFTKVNFSFGNVAVGEVDETDGVTLVNPSTPKKQTEIVYLTT